MEVAEVLHDKTPSQEKVKLQVINLNVQSNIQYRYARTVVSSKVVNPSTLSQEATFSMVLPQTAFISGFFMEVDGEEYHAYVNEKDKAKLTYVRAVRHGQTAGHIALSSRDSNRFIISVNVEPEKEVTFNLTYEELLTRKLGTYKHVINLDPGQIVKDLNVEVHIKDCNNIVNLEVPAFKVGAEIDVKPLKGIVNKLAIINHPTEQSAVVKFAPNLKEQEELAEDGIKGQLIVQYDVDRTSHYENMLVSNGYFAHYFAPEDLKPLPKHVIFTLDISPSMSGRKIKQLKEAMYTILNDLRHGDYFTLVSFDEVIKIWVSSACSHWKLVEGEDSEWGNVVVSANCINKIKAKLAVCKLRVDGATNMYDAFKISTKAALLGKKLKMASSCSLQKPEPIIIFLTDGQPTAGNTNKDQIMADTTEWNRESKASIFSLALGDDADLEFLKKLSLRNSGIGIKIYEASDTALQLRDFYRQVASPLVADVTFNYGPEQVNMEYLTKNQFPTFYSGTELIVAGHLNKMSPGQKITYEVSGRTTDGIKNFDVQQPIVISEQGPDNEPGFLERLWAYLRIQQLLDEEKSSDNAIAVEKKKEATTLALKYSFVTPVTSLVVVKPKEKTFETDVKPVDQEDIRMVDEDGEEKQRVLLEDLEDQCDQLADGEQFMTGDNPILQPTYCYYSRINVADSPSLECRQLSFCQDIRVSTATQDTKKALTYCSRQSRITRFIRFVGHCCCCCFRRC